ncbi:MAG TPA: hypothetical protein ENO22_14630 [candidate division Zixibacteria bacterium]|nr:hypothetical protein [candidate division Zixibacteria bacterium]
MRRTTFILGLCLTILVMFIAVASAQEGIDKKNDSKACVKNDPRPECQTDNEKAEIQTASSDKKECPYHKAEVKVASSDKKECPHHKAEVETAAVTTEEKHEEGAGCTHGLKTNCIETFHEAMAPPCHEYIPQGKYAEARAAVPAMVEASKEIAEYYPGCTYGKNINEQFEAKREVFLNRMAELEEAANGDDDEAFKLAFDKMHSAFAEMNGVLYMRPDGVEDFHNVLVQIWHEYLPNEKYAEIESSIPELTEKAEYLTTVKLDETMADKQEAFTQKAEKLLKCVNDLSEACKSEDKEKIASTTETMHQSFESLTATF